MKAVRLHRIGELSVDDVPTPTAEPGEVLLRVGAVGVCGSDLPRVMLSGAHRMPVTIGHEFAGTIVELGAGADGWSVGDRVTVAPLLPCGHCRWCRQGLYHLCASYDYFGSRRDGALAEYVNVPVANLVKLPDGVSLEVGAMADPSATALHALWRAKISAGATVAVYGAGPIGLYAVQWARILGAQRIVAVDVWDDKLDLAQELGATHTVNARSEDPVQRIEQITDGWLADTVLEFAALQTTQVQAIRSARRQGTVILVGISHDDLHLPEAAVERIMRHEIAVTGSWNSNSLPYPGREWQLTVDYFATGQLQGDPLVSHRYSLADAPEIFPRLYRREFSFNKVLFLP